MWEPLPVPAAAIAHAPLVNLTGPGSPLVPAAGQITSGACYAWNDCWFFGTFGVVLHWDGTALSDATPSSVGPTTPGAGYSSAIARIAAAGGEIGVAATDAPPSGAETNQLSYSNGAAFEPLADFQLFPSDPLESVEYPLDVESVDIDSSGQGWAAENTVGLRTAIDGTGNAGSLQFPIIEPNYATGPTPVTSAPTPVPLQPFSAGPGASGSCGGPPATRFVYQSTTAAPDMRRAPSSVVGLGPPDQRSRARRRRNPATEFGDGPQPGRRARRTGARAGKLRRGDDERHDFLPA